VGWKCLDDACYYKIFSLSDEFSRVVEQVIDFFLSFSGGFYALVVLFGIASFIMYMFWYVRRVGSGYV